MEEIERQSAEMTLERSSFQLTMVIENVRSMHNVGSCFRTADALGLTEIVLCGYTPTPPHRDIQKTALGAADTVSWRHFENVTEALQALQNKGYSIWAAEQATGSVFLQNIKGSVMGSKVAVVFGNEVTGVSDNALALCEGCIEIPQFGSKHSLNVAVSAGIILWEIVKMLNLTT